MDPTLALTAAIDNATKVANTPLFTTVIDRITGFKISQWSAEGDIRKKIIQDEYEKAKNNGIEGVQFIATLRSTTNLIDVATKSTKYVDAGKANEVKMDNDFFWNTIEHAKSVSNDEMQDLIAKIIAGEYNVPGTYSMSTLHILKMLGRDELNLCERVGNLVLSDSLIPEILFSQSKKGDADFLNELGIDFGIFQTLQCFGIILPNEMRKTIPNPEKSNFYLSYFDKKIIFVPVNDNYKEIRLPNFFKLTIAGEQILKHLNPQFNENYFNWIKANFKILNYKVEEQ